MQKVLIMHILFGISRASEKHTICIVYSWWYIRGVNKGRLPAFAGGNVLLAGGKISDRPVAFH